MRWIRTLSSFACNRLATSPAITLFLMCGDRTILFFQSNKQTTSIRKLPENPSTTSITPTNTLHQGEPLKITLNFKLTKSNKNIKNETSKIQNIQKHSKLKNFLASNEITPQKTPTGSQQKTTLGTPSEPHQPNRTPSTAPWRSPAVQATRVHHGGLPTRGHGLPSVKTFRVWLKTRGVFEEKWSLAGKF